MPTDKRRAEARRRAWGRGPMILRFEPLESRELLSTAAATATAPAPKPDLVGQSFQTPTDLTWGGTFQAQGVVVNQGNASADKPFHVDIYASPTPAVDKTNAVLLGEATVAAGLKPGSHSAYDVPLTLPANPIQGLSPSGSFYIATVIDPQGVVGESDTANNADTGAGFDYQLVTPPTVQSASLVGTGLMLSPSETGWGGSFVLSQTITNNGNADAPATRARVVLTPAGTAPGGAADVTLGSISVPAIAAGQSATVNPSVTLPEVPPSSLKGVSQFTVSVVQDADYATNAMYPHAADPGRAALTVTTPSYLNVQNASKPGLEVAGVAVDSQSIKWGQSFQVGATLENLGTVDPGPFRVRYLLVGADGTVNNSLFLADTTVNGLAPGGTPQNIVTTLKLPAAPPVGATLNSQGVARIAVIVDPENTVDEPRTNTAAVSAPIQLQVVGSNGVTTTAANLAATTATASTTTVKATAVKATRTTQTATKTPSKPTHTTAPKPAKSPVKAKTVKPAKHTIEHNLKVFPNSVYKYFKKTFHA